MASNIFEKDIEAFQQFLYLVYYTNPVKENVRIILDDGSIRITMNRDRFIERICSVIDPSDIRFHKTISQFKKSIYAYGKIFAYDRTNDIFKELMTAPDMSRIQPSEIFHESRKNLAIDQAKSDFKNINDLYKPISEIKSPFTITGTKNNLLHNIIRTISTKR